MDKQHSFVLFIIV